MNDATIANAWEYFNPRTEIDIHSGGDLPHWQQGAVWYFITYRLADSLPSEIVRKKKNSATNGKERTILKTSPKKTLPNITSSFLNDTKLFSTPEAAHASCAIRKTRK
jgi:hypothetical protein